MSTVNPVGVQQANTPAFKAKKINQNELKKIFDGTGGDNFAAKNPLKNIYHRNEKYEKYLDEMNANLRKNVALDTYKKLNEAGQVSKK